MNKASILLLVVAACGNPSQASHQPDPERADKAMQSVVVASPRTQQMTSFPCSECHHTVELQKPTMPPREPHTRIVFAHMPNVGDCYQCHDQNNIDQLRLLTGGAVPMDQAEQVCGQCHPDKKRDWDLGIHGKSVGSWRGIKHRFACTDCHDPHSPARPTVQALPPPPFPELGIRKGAHP